jgi:UDPglucose--hexose-1-phosphate uridylyltransferase
MSAAGDAENATYAVVGGTEASQRADQQSETRLVWNPFWAEYTGFAPARMRRRELTDECPFCADLTSGRVPAGTSAWIRPNDFPALKPPTGECYIIIYSADHNRTFSGLTVPEVVRILGLWQRLYTDLSARYPAVMTWETCGEEIGQTQRHPHGQTYAISIMPDYLAREMAFVEREAAAGNDCPFCVELRREQDSARSLVTGEHWVGFVPPYARYPYQVRLTPRRHVSSIAEIASEGPEAEELAADLLRILRAYDAAYHAPMPYMLAIHQLADPRYHVHFELLPVGRAPGKLKLAASSEMAWGFWMNDALPEARAEELRALLAREVRP